MTGRSHLTYAAFLTLARQQGFEMDILHLNGLFTEVQAMFQRIGLLDQVDTSGIQPGSSSIIPTDAVPPG